MFKTAKAHLPFIIYLIIFSSFVLYFSLFTIERYQKLYSHYFDLGIMNQTTYNTYMGLKTSDFSRILEMTDPHAGTDQVKRMAVHNDFFLAIIAPLYFIHDGTETMLVAQTLVVALGSYFVLLLAEDVFRKSKYNGWIAFAFATSFLLYPPLQKAVNFDFHAVTLSVTFLLGFYFFSIKRKYFWSFLFAFLAISTKENIGLIVSFIGIYLYFKDKKINRKYLLFSIFFGLFWTFFSMSFIIPYFRGESHFGTGYYSYLKEDPLKIFQVIFRYESFHYVSILLSPVGFLSVLSPLLFLTSSSEFGINILSANSNMRNIYFHYDAALTSVIFISAIYGGKNLVSFLSRKTKYSSKFLEKTLIFYVLISAVIFSLYMSPLPWSHHGDSFIWQNKEAKQEDVKFWQGYLKKDSIPVSTSGHIAPNFSSRRYFYDLPGGYEKAEYVIVDTWDITQGFQSEESTDQYNKLKNDWRYIRIYDRNNIEVFKKI